MNTAYGIFNKDGTLIEAGFYVKSVAADHAKRMKGVVKAMCKEHADQAKDGCKLCAEDAADDGDATDTND